MVYRTSIITTALIATLSACAPQSDLHPIPLVAPQQRVVVQEAPPPPVRRVVRKKPAPVRPEPVVAQPVREPMPAIINPIERQPEGGWGGMANGAEWNPPAKYDHPYKGLLREYRLPQKQVVSVCKQVFSMFKSRNKATLKQRGCSVFNSDRSECTIVYIDKPFMGATPEAVRRHEIGHCNGWDHD